MEALKLLWNQVKPAFFRIPFFFMTYVDMMCMTLICSEMPMMIGCHFFWTTMAIDACMLCAIYTFC